MNGHARERAVAKYYRTFGYLVASLRHTPGPGDLLVIAPATEGGRTWLVEVKANAAGPWSHYGPVDRARLAHAARVYGIEAVLAWWPAGGPLELYPEHVWPGANGDARHRPAQLQLVKRGARVPTTGYRPTS